jgi:deazaflavin-dependent oxidoreductase (nitroreductase family)
MQQRTIDITTTGRRSGEPRRIETVFRRVDDVTYLTGIPASRPRAWLLNLVANPTFTFHFKHGVVADLPATATVITDPAERRQVLAPIVEQFNRHNGPGSEWGEAVLDDWVADAPLARVTFDDD